MTPSIDPSFQVPQDVLDKFPAGTSSADVELEIREDDNGEYEIYAVLGNQSVLACIKPCSSVLG